MVGRRSPNLLALMLAVFGLAESVNAQAPTTRDDPCAVHTTIEPADALTGQQLLYRDRIFRRSDVEAIEWEQAPAFPGFRSEWLPGRPEDTVEEIDGARYLVREEHRALFPTRAGTLELPPAAMLCRFQTGGSRKAQTLRIQTRPQPVRIVEPASEGQPVEFDGIVGALTVHTRVDRTEIELGESVRVSVLLRGVGSLWHAGLPLRSLDETAGLEVFREATQTDSEPGEKLQVRRFYRLDVVPSSPGPLEIPETRIVYLDPTTRAYRFASSPAIAIDVQPKSSANPDSRSTPSQEPVRDSGGSALPGWAMAGALLAIGAGVVLHLRKRGPQLAALDEELARARAAGEKGDTRGEAAGYARALRSALEASAPALAKLDGPSLRAEVEALAVDRPELMQAANVLAELERNRYSSEATRPDVGAAEAAILKVRKRVMRQRPSR